MCCNMSFSKRHGSLRSIRRLPHPIETLKQRNFLPLNMKKNCNFLWTFSEIQGRRKLWYNGGANDFCGTLLLQYRNVEGAKFYSIPKKYYGCYHTEQNTYYTPSIYRWHALMQFFVHRGLPIVINDWFEMYFTSGNFR